jgi:hypothetical protein
MTDKEKIKELRVMLQDVCKYYNHEAFDKKCENGICTYNNLCQPNPTEPENDPAAEMCYNRYFTVIISFGERYYEPVRIKTNGKFMKTSHPIYKLCHNKDKNKFWFVKVNERGEEI